MSTQSRTEFHEGPRTNSPSAQSVVVVRNDALTVAAFVVAGIAMILAVSSFCWGYIAEREARIVQGDVTFIRAYLNARGIDVPGSHEDAEAE